MRWNLMGLSRTVRIKHYAHYQDNLPEHVSRLDATSEHCLTKRNMNSMSQLILA
jgi:hypothetical protein